MVNDKEIPLKSFLIIHSQARLSNAQRKEIVEWADELREVIKLKEP